MKRHLLRLFACATVLSGGVLIYSISPAAAVEAEYAWWSAASAPGGSLPGAPTDGIYVSLGPTVPAVTGPVPDVVGGQVPAPVAPFAVGAIRFPADATATAVLTLAVTASSAPPQGTLTSALLACPITAPKWVPVQNGSFDKRPEFDCNGVASVGAVSPDGKQVSWELSPIFQAPAGSVDVALVALGQSPYFVSFAKPGPTAVSITPSDEPSGSGDEPSPDTSGAFAPGATADTGSGSTAFDPGTVDTGLPTADTGTVDTTPADSVEVTAPEIARPSLPIARAPKLAAAIPKGRDGWRIVFGALLVLIGGGLFWMAGENTRLPRLIGPLHTGAPPVEVADEDVSGVRGIGRYARARVGSPRRIR